MTNLDRGFAPSVAGSLRRFYVFLWVLSPNPEPFGWFVPIYPLTKFISHTGCGGDLPPRYHLSRVRQEIFWYYFD